MKKYHPSGKSRPSALASIERELVCFLCPASSFDRPGGTNLSFEGRRSTRWQAKSGRSFDRFSTLLIPSVRAEGATRVVGLLSSHLALSVPVGRVAVSLLVTRSLHLCFCVRYRQRHSSSLAFQLVPI